MIRQLSHRLAIALSLLSATGAVNAEAETPRTETPRTETLRTETPRIVFFGDSLTEEATSASGFITLIREGLRSSPNTPDTVALTGAGVRGDTVRDLAERVNADVLKLKPSVVVILVGINDIVRLPRGTGTEVEPFIAALRKIVGQIQQQGARVVLATPPVIGEDNHNQFSELLMLYRNHIENLSRETGTSLVDLRNDFLLFLSKRNFQNKSSGLLTRDGVHLSAAGNELVAQAMLPELQRLLAISTSASKTE